MFGRPKKMLLMSCWVVVAVDDGAMKEFFGFVLECPPHYRLEYHNILKWGSFRKLNLLEIEKLITLAVGEGLISVQNDNGGIVWYLRL